MESSYQAKPTRVVVGIDFSATSKGVLLRALELANQAENSELHAISVFGYDGPVLGFDGPSAGATTPDPVRLQEFVTSAVQDFSSRGPVRVRRVVTHVLLGAPAPEIVWLAAHLDADLIVVGTHGRRGITRALLGSVAERVVRTAGCAVYVVRDKHHDGAWRVPDIEPPCPDCVDVRNASSGQKLWCERHQSHVHTHVYSGAETTSSAVRPWGFST